MRAKWLGALIAGALLLAAQAHAQSASVTVFGPMQAPVSDEADGALATRTSDFALYELGHWSRRARQFDEASLSGMVPVASNPLPASVQAMPVTLNDRCGRGYAPPRLLDARTSRARRIFWPTIAAAECRWGLPAGLMDSLILAESRYDPSIVSPAGAAGLAQLMPSTANDLGVADRFNPIANIEGGAHYLRALLDGFGGNVPLALAAYNAGPTAVRRHGRIPLNGETPGYVDRVLGYWTAPGIGPTSPALSTRQTAQMLGFYPSVTN